MADLHGPGVARKTDENALAARGRNGDCNGEERDSNKTDDIGCGI